MCNSNYQPVHSVETHRMMTTDAQPSEVPKAENEPVAPGKSAQKKWTLVQWITLATLALSNFSTGACTSLQAPFFPKEAEAKGASATEYGLVFGIYQLTIFATSPIIGKLVAYVSPKYTLNFGVSAVGIACIIFGTLDVVSDSKTFVGLALGVRVAEGFGTACCHTSVYTIAAARYEESLARSYSILQTFYAVGLITGPTLGGALYDLGGYRLPFYVMGSILLADAVMIFFVLPKPETKERVSKPNLFRFYWHPVAVIYSLSVFTTYYFIGFIIVTIEPLIRQFHLSGPLMGFMCVIPAAVHGLASPCNGWLLDKKCDSDSLSLVGCSFAVASILLIGPAPFFHFETELWVIIIALVLTGVSYSAKIVSAFTGLFRSAESRGYSSDVSTYGLVSSMIISSLSLGAFVGPSLGGFLCDKFGYRNATMSLLVLESVLIIMLVSSIVSRKMCNSASVFTLTDVSISTTKSEHTDSKRMFATDGIIKNI